MGSAPTTALLPSGLRCEASPPERAQGVGGFVGDGVKTRVVPPAATALESAGVRALASVGARGGRRWEASPPSGETACRPLAAAADGLELARTDLLFGLVTALLVGLTFASNLLFGLALSGTGQVWPLATPPRGLAGGTAAMAHMLAAAAAAHIWASRADGGMRCEAPQPSGLRRTCGTRCGASRCEASRCEASRPVGLRCTRPVRSDTSLATGLSWAAAGVAHLRPCTGQLPVMPPTADDVGVHVGAEAFPRVPGLVTPSVKLSSPMSSSVTTLHLRCNIFGGTPVAVALLAAWQVLFFVGDEEEVLWEPVPVLACEISVSEEAAELAGSGAWTPRESAPTTSRLRPVPRRRRGDIEAASASGSSSSSTSAQAPLTPPSARKGCRVAAFATS